MNAKSSGRRRSAGMPGRTSRHGISSLYKKLGIIYIRLVRTRNKLTLVNFFMTPYQYFMWLSFTCIFGKRKITQNVFCSVENRIVKCSSWDCLEMWVRLYRPASMRGVSETALFRDFYAKKSLSSLLVLGVLLLYHYPSTCKGYIVLLDCSIVCHCPCCKRNCLV